MHTHSRPCLHPTPQKQSGASSWARCSTRATTAPPGAAASMWGAWPSSAGSAPSWAPSSRSACATPCRKVRGCVWGGMRTVLFVSSFVTDQCYLHVYGRRALVVGGGVHSCVCICICIFIQQQPPPFNPSQCTHTNHPHHKKPNTLHPHQSTRNSPTLTITPTTTDRGAAALRVADPLPDRLRLRLPRHLPEDADQGELGRGLA